MRDVPQSLLHEAMEGDGVLRVPRARAADASLQFLIERGLITPLPFADAAGLETWYAVGAAACLQTRDSWAALYSAHR
jgi:hypothetical protein